MNKLLSKIGIGAALAATALTTATAADAQRYGGGFRGGGYHGGYYGRGGYGYRGNVAGAAVVGGLVGLGVGAAIASRPYYGYGGYYGYPAYYGYPGYAYYPHCWTEFRGYYGRPVRVCR
jgi:hypothetical protein